MLTNCCGDDTFFSELHICYAHFVCRESTMTTYTTLLAWLAEHFLVEWYQQRLTIHHVATIVITKMAHCFHDYIYIMPILLLTATCRGSTIKTYIMLLCHHYLVYWYQQSVTVHHVLKCMTCQKNNAAINGNILLF